MRLVVDLQACQTDSRDRGIGRYSMSLVQAIASELGDKDELIIAIDMADASRARDVRIELRRRNVCAKVVAYGYPTTPHSDATPAVRRLAGQLRARFYASLQPDALLLCSLFETNAVYSTELDWDALGHIPTAVIGYDLIPLLFPRRYLPKRSRVTDWYHARLDDLHRFGLILAISEATRRDLVTHLQIADERIAVVGAGFDAALLQPLDPARGERRLRALGIHKPFVLTIGNGDWRKNTLGALRAFAALPASLRMTHELVLTRVGHDVDVALEAEYAALRDQVRILGKVDDATLALLYRECRVFYFPSYYEGFGLPVLEAMAFDAPVLTSNAGALPEVVHDPRTLFDVDSPVEGPALLARALSDDRFRDEIRRGGREHALGFSWGRVAGDALAALRRLAERKHCEPAGAGVVHDWPKRSDVTLMADACGEAGPQGEGALDRGLRAIARCGKRRVLVDITEIMRLDARTGIQRVTRNFFAGLAAVARDGAGFTVDPFCWTEGAMRYARGYARDQLGVPCEGTDTPVHVQPSDVVFMLDSSWWSPERFDELHVRVHMAGGEVVWMVYDLIPIRFPETCGPDMPAAFRTWLTHAVQTSDGFVCISEATRNDLEAFMHAAVVDGGLRPWTCTAYLGGDLDPAVKPAPSARSQSVHAALAGRPYLVALGTVEPRKDHATILTAFELLWARGVDMALVIIGKQGWNVAELAARIQHHPEHGARLFWLQGLGDGDVRDLLEGSKGLIQASISEGFGLPLIEAGSLGVSLVASDIPVFHEVAGAAAAYFPVGDAAALAEAVAAVGSRGKTANAPLQVRPLPWLDASRRLAKVLGLPSRQQ